MPREAKGQLKWWGNRYSVRVRFRDGHRQWVPLSPELTHTQAAAQAQELARRARTEPRPPTGKLFAIGDETVEQWSNRWATYRESRVERPRTDRSSLRTHVLPLIGHERMATIPAARIEDVRDALDEKVRANEIAWQTARNCWVVVRVMFRDARSAKQRELRVRHDNPCLEIAPPETGAAKAKQFLFPSEFSQLISCSEVPLLYRRIFTLATYLYLRASELEALAWEDIDLRHGTAHVHRSLKERGRIEKPTKTGNTRRFAIEPALMPLLRALHRETGGVGRIIGMLNGVDKYAFARSLRQYLAVAGVDRAELFANDKTRKWITFHDLRATGITWMAVKGVGPLNIKQRAGHAELSTTEKYIRVAEELRPGFGQVFPPLPHALLGARDGDVTNQPAADAAE
jgi:integrase